jgi:hypothetical protein
LPIQQPQRWTTRCLCSACLLNNSSKADLVDGTAGGKGLLRIGFGSEGEHLVLRDFQGDTKGLNDALALLEHVTSSS